MLPDSILPTPEDDIARILRDYERRLSHLETLEGGGGFEIGTRVRNSASITIPNNVATILTFNTENYDTDSIHDNAVNPSRLTCRTAGKYVIAISVLWSGNATGLREVQILINGATTIANQRDNMAGADAHGQVFATIYELAVDDFAEMRLFQNSGANRLALTASDYSPAFMMQKVG